MLRAVEINSRKAGDEELRRLYETAFPVGEQIPYDDLIHLMDIMDIDYNAYYDGEMLVGFMMVLRLPKYNWGWYFAVREELRGKGYGQGILTDTLDKYRNSGYRYAVSDTEFMTVMVHGRYNLSGKDPLSPERHVLHPSVSTGQSPVVLNDVSLPSAFFGTYGWSAYLVYFSLMVLLIIAVVAYSLPSKRQMDLGSEIDVRTIWRLLAVMMWAGTSFYLYLSYVGRFPFTGRLNPGFGVDSVGEALESVILLAFMTATLLGKSPSTRTKISRR